MKQKTRGILQVLLLAIIIGYYTTSTFSTHTHYFEWGKVTHSHPYFPSSAHTHTSAEYYLIEHLTNLVFVGVALAVAFSCLQVFSLYCHSLRRLACINKGCASVPLQRGPPAYL